MTKVSVVIPSLYEKDGDYLKLCVESLRATVDWDIIVVTNGTPNKPDLRHIQGISTHLHTKDQGQCVATNIGAQVVSPNTDYILVSNSDMYYAPGWNKNLRFDHLVFSPNLVEPTTGPGSAPPFLTVDGGFTLDQFDKELVDSCVEYAVEENKGNEESGFNLPFFIQGDVWQTIGGYDEEYDPWGSNSDTDLQTKIDLAGIRPVRLRDVLVYHFSNKSGTFDGSHQEEWHHNFDYYTWKWGFNRDTTPGTDVWYHKNLIDYSNLKYHPDWEGKYGQSI